jgi:hypothetical protein
LIKVFHKNLIIFYRLLNTILTGNIKTYYSCGVSEVVSASSDTGASGSGSGAGSGSGTGVGSG